MDARGFRKAEVVRDRHDVIRPLVSGRRVLDLGVVDSRRQVEPTSVRLEHFASSLHEFVRQHAALALGVDIDEEGVSILNQRGYQVVCANVETMDLGQTFDVVVAGEIIEHLPNPGLALANIRRHLSPGGQLILTTCNPFSISQFWKIVKYGNVQVHDEHTAWFDPHTLGRLLSMSGFDAEELYWLRPHRRHSRLRMWPASVRRYFSSAFLLVARCRSMEAAA